MKVTSKQVIEAEAILKRKKDEDRIIYEEAQKARIKMYEGTFWRGPTNDFADKDGVYVMKALKSDFGATIFEMWKYAHVGMYEVSHQRFYQLHKEMQPISELEFYVDVRRFMFKIKATEALEE